MSGGHWNYMQHRFDELVDESSIINESLRFLGQIEHELDWGHSCDTCLGCARLRVLSALDVFYDNGANAKAAIAILRDHQAVENYCDECLVRLPTWHRREGARPTLAEAEKELARRREYERLKR